MPTNWKDIAELVGIAAIVLGLVLVTIELRQNNELMADQARFNRLAMTTDNWTTLAQDPELAGIWLKVQNGQSMTPLEQSRWESWSMRILLTREWSFLELPRSDLPVDTWRRVTKHNAPLRNVYEREKDSFDPAFVAWFDENVLAD